MQLDSYPKLNCFHSVKFFTVIMRITRFRSAWGIEPGTNLDNWAKWFPELRQHGYRSFCPKIINDTELIGILQAASKSTFMD